MLLCNAQLVQENFTCVDTQIKRVPLDIVKKVEYYIHCYLSVREQSKLARQRSEQTRYNMLWARIMIKQIFSSQSGIPTSAYRDVEILNSVDDNVYGLPILTYKGMQQDKYLAISHYDHEVGVSCSSAPCGIDIVKVFDQMPEQSFLDYSFTENEHSQLNKITKMSDYLAMITLLWGIKEAISKYLGCGLRYGPGTIGIRYEGQKNFIHFLIHPKVHLVQKWLLDNISVKYFWNTGKTYCYVYVCQLQASEERGGADESL